MMILISSNDQKEPIHTDLKQQERVLITRKQVNRQGCAFLHSIEPKKDDALFTCFCVVSWANPDVGSTYRASIVLYMNKIHQAETSYDDRFAQQDSPLLFSRDDYVKLWRPRKANSRRATTV
ncbi:hypothetical protein OSB04_015924 [Centaurea solstitialis]|uniref:Uncharacterized protein n=1 Tax=Centaurea solstitialis TaxID=347529 RepID=A0AA38SZY6_9ASTR|nr:hypothetical protein OSB04_015924 [Centaurea solstitialis]